MTSACSNIPVELVLATTDPDLYNPSSGQWGWGGVMYWAVECLPNRQNTISDGVVPNIDPASYQQLTTSPTAWDYCKSSNCSAGSDTMHLVFTFYPASADPMDYLQYVIDVNCRVSDFPRHPITDPNGQPFYFDIIELEKMITEPYVEVWIAKASGPSSSEMVKAIDSQVRATQRGGLAWYWWILVLLVLLVLLIGGAVGLYILL